MNKITLRRNLFEGNGVLTQKFGENPDAYARFGLKGHNGIDYGIPIGTKLYSAINGKVIEVIYDAGGYGNYIKIENDYCGVIYGHMRELSSLKAGDYVDDGQLLGYSGNTGNSTGPHLHFGVFPIPRDRSNGYAGYIDPLGDQIEWVDDILSPANDYEKTISVLNKMLDDTEKELDDMRESRNRWRDQHDALEEKYEKDMTAKADDIQRLQNTLQETNVAHIEATKKLSTIIEKAEQEISELKVRNIDLKNEKLELSDQVQELPKLKEKIEKLKKPIKELSIVEYLTIKYRG
jgi:hypothetical protein